MSEERLGVEISFAEGRLEVNFNMPVWDKRPSFLADPSASRKLADGPSYKLLQEAIPVEMQPSCSWLLQCVSLAIL